MDLIMKIFFYYSTLVLLAAYSPTTNCALAITPAQAQTNLETAVRLLDVDAAQKAIQDGAKVSFKADDPNRPYSYIPYFHLLAQGMAYLHLSPSTSQERQAVEQKYALMVQFLLDNGADINEPGSSFQDTALHVAATHSNEPFATLLIDKKANVNAQAKAGTTPLQIAVRQASIAMVKLLLANGADPNIQDEKGDSSLHQVLRIHNLAAFNNTQPRDIALQIAKLLIAYGANPNLKNNLGLTPLIFAKKLNEYQPALRNLVRELEKPNLPIIWALMGQTGLPKLPPELVKDIAHRADLTLDPRS